MTETAGNGDCGCGQSLQTKQVGKGTPVGSDWSAIVQNIMKNGATQARAHLKTQEPAGEGDVEVCVAMTVFLRFPHKGQRLKADEADARCVCTNDGRVCVCYGQCDFDACCDPPPAGPIVASA